MKRRILAILLTGALVLSLAACGGKGNDVSVNPDSGSSNQEGGLVSDGSAAPGGSQSEPPIPDASLPGGADASEPEPGADSGASNPSEAEIKLTLNRSNIELNKAGATFQLRYTVDPDIYDGLAVFTSSNAKVASVDESGTVKAVAPGKANITVKYGSATATVSVSCNWVEELEKPDTSNPADSKPGNEPSAPGGVPSGPILTVPPAPEGTLHPDPADEPSTPNEPSESTGEPSESVDNPSASANVDLSAFYSAITGKYTFPMPMLADDEILDNFYAGMTGISAEQRLIYICGTNVNNGEFGLVEVKDGKDVAAVKNIFQARIDAQANGGAWYPQAVESWTNNSRVVSNGNYVMMVVHENCDDIVREFNALF